MLCAVSVLSTPLLALTVPEETELVSSCREIASLADRLTNNLGRPSKDGFSKKSDAKQFKELSSAFSGLPEGDSVARTLRKAKTDKARRSAVKKSDGWCEGEGAYAPTKLELPSRFDVVDSEVVRVSGTTQPGAVVTVAVGANQTPATVDGAGAFAIDLAGIPLDKDTIVTVQAEFPSRISASKTISVKRTLSEAAKAAIAAQAEADFKGQAQQIPYADLIRPNGPIGAIVTYRVQVFQYDFNTGASSFLAYLTPGRYFWSDLAQFKLPDPGLGSGVGKGSFVRVWGIVGIPYSYSTQAGGSNTVPSILVRYIEPA